MHQKCKSFLIITTDVNSIFTFQIISTAFRIFVCLANGILEAWYSMEGYRYLFGPGIFTDQVTKYIQSLFGESEDTVDYVHFHIQSWAAASVRLRTYAFFKKWLNFLIFRHFILSWQY